MAASVSSSFPDFLTSLPLPDPSKASLLHQFHQMQHEIASLTLEKASLKSDSEALAAALKRFTGITTPSSSLIYTKEQEINSLEAFLQRRNEQLVREIEVMKTEIGSLKGKIELLNTKCGNLEMENTELEGKLAQIKSFSSENRVFSLPNRSSKDQLSSVFLEKELSRLTHSLSSEKSVLSAYKSQNESLKSSRSELICHCQQLLSTTQMLQERVISLDEQRRNAEFVGWMWRNKWEEVREVCGRCRDVCEKTAEGLRKGGEVMEAVKQLQACPEVPVPPSIVPERPLPQSFPVVAEPPLSMLEHLARAQQEVVQLTERCSQQEAASSLLLNRSLLHLLSVLHRLTKSLKS